MFPATLSRVLGEPLLLLASGRRIPSRRPVEATRSATRTFADYARLSGRSYTPQQLHGIKAAFSDFLKLRHGGSGFLFAHGAGPTGSGDLILSRTCPTASTQPATPYPVRLGVHLLACARLTQPTQPVAAERPYRSLSYPDINYTIMRPASLPPSPVVDDQCRHDHHYRWNDGPHRPVTGLPLAGEPVRLRDQPTQYGESRHAPPSSTSQLQPFLAPRNQADQEYRRRPGRQDHSLPIRSVRPA